jgi:hypothetical protein
MSGDAHVGAIEISVGRPDSHPVLPQERAQHFVCHVTALPTVGAQFRLGGTIRTGCLHLPHPVLEFAIVIATARIPLLMPCFAPWKRLPILAQMASIAIRKRGGRGGKDVNAG